MAVIVAILLVALAASSAAFMLAQHEAWATQVESVGARARADAGARAGLEAARVFLADPQAAADPQLPLGGLRGVLDKGQGEPTSIDIRYADAQGAFNINNLVNAESPSLGNIEVFARLLAGVGAQPELAGAVVDAIDADSDVSVPGGAEDLDYLSMQPPQRAANRPMLEAGSLARVKGCAPAVFARLRHLVTALPEATAINVNAASPEILMAATPGLTVEDAARLVSARPFADVAAFRAQLPEQARSLPGVALDVKSRYVVVTILARSGRAEAAYQALIGRPGAARPGVVWSRQVDQ